LNEETLTRVTSSVAATGNDASARVRQTKEAKPKTIYLGENQITFQVEEEELDKEDVIKEMQDKYRSVKST
jgi:hypothetical protein